MFSIKENPPMLSHLWGVACNPIIVANRLLNATPIFYNVGVSHCYRRYFTQIIYTITLTCKYGILTWLFSRCWQLESWATIYKRWDHIFYCQQAYSNIVVPGKWTSLCLLSEQQRTALAILYPYSSSDGSYTHAR